MHVGIGRTLLISLLIVIAAGCRRCAPEHEVVTPEQDAIRIAAERVRDGSAHFFTLKHEGRNVNFFLRRDSQGRVHAHFDACYGCYRYRRGYRQQDRQVVCLACRIGFDLDAAQWDYVGPCVPIDLPCRIGGSEVTVSASALRKGWRFF